MIYVIALRQAARTGDRWQVLSRAYYSVCEALADARRARKMGHVTCIGRTAEEAMDRAREAARILHLPEPN